MSRDCYQCGKCSAGCPMAERMDLLPNRLIRLVQLDGFCEPDSSKQASSSGSASKVGHSAVNEKLLKATSSQAIWQCVSCQTCTTRCPQSVDCAGIIDALRELSVVWGTTSSALNRTVVFQRVFLDNIRRNGRLDEMELIGLFKMKAFLGDFSVPLLFKDAMLGPQMIPLKKLHLRGEKVRDRGLVSRIFSRCQPS